MSSQLPEHFCMITSAPTHATDVHLTADVTLSHVCLMYEAPNNHWPAHTCHFPVKSLHIRLLQHTRRSIPVAVLHHGRVTCHIFPAGRVWTMNSSWSLGMLEWHGTSTMRLILARQNIHPNRPNPHQHEWLPRGRLQPLRCELHGGGQARSCETECHTII